VPLCLVSSHLIFKAHISKIQIYSHTAAKPENAELYAIKNEYGSVNGGDEVWIRGSKMIKDCKQLDILVNKKVMLITCMLYIATVLFEIWDHTSHTTKSYHGVLKKEECHQVYIQYTIAIFYILLIM